MIIIAAMFGKLRRGIGEGCGTTPRLLVFEGQHDGFAGVAMRNSVQKFNVSFVYTLSKAAVFAVLAPPMTATKF